MSFGPRVLSLVRHLVVLAGLAGCLWAGGAGCAYSRVRWQYDRDLLEADRMADRGQYDEARAAYEALAWQTVRDEDLRYIRHQLAYLYELDERWDEAIVAYRAIANDPGDTYDDSPARALYRIGRIQARELGLVADALETWDAVVVSFPNSVFAEDAMMDIIRHWRREGQPEVASAWLADRAVQLERSEIGDNLFYWNARVIDEDFDQPADALPWYERVMLNFPRGSLGDDALWRYAECLHRLERFDEEYELLLGFIDRREVSLMVADYDSAYYNDALYRMAEIHEARGENLEAVRVWERCLSTFPLSIEADDQAFHILELLAPLRECGRMRDWHDYLRDEHRHSRHLDEAAALMAEVCP